MTVLSRASDLARLQAMLVGRALAARWPDLDIHYLTRSSAGDRESDAPLASMPDKGAFTADLSDQLASGQADLVVHSWKDLPLEGRPGTIIAGTLERADPRDVLLVRRDVLVEQPRSLQVLSSSPRRTWLLEQSLPGLLPWRVDEVRAVPVRGNIPTRLTRLLEGRGHALVVAKAALDRLAGFGPPFEQAATAVRRALDACRWMVLPIREVPGAPAQGAVAVEIAEGNQALLERLQAISHAPTWNAVGREREVLASFGGGCHEAVGATVLPREFGHVLSVRAHTASGADESWSLLDAATVTSRVPASHVWPRPDERQDVVRRQLDVAQPADDRGYWVARAQALPETWDVTADRLVWTAGVKTWRKLAARGIWVNGCADGLGDAEPPQINQLAGRQAAWLRLTHLGAADAHALATYVVDEKLPDDLPDRTHFFWTSGSQLLAALVRFPELRARAHASGPGRTWRTLRDALGPDAQADVWLDYDHWYREVVS